MGIDSGGGDSRNRLTGIDNESISIGVAAPPPPLAGGRGGAAGAARRFLQLPPRRQPAGRGRGVSGIVSSIVSSISARPPALTRRPIVDGVDFWIVFFFWKIESSAVAALDRTNMERVQSNAESVGTLFLRDGGWSISMATGGCAAKN